MLGVIFQISCSSFDLPATDSFVMCFPSGIEIRIVFYLNNSVSSLHCYLCVSVRVLLYGIVVMTIVARHALILVTLATILLLGKVRTDRQVCATGFSLIELRKGVEMLPYWLAEKKSRRWALIAVGKLFVLPLSWYTCSIHNRVRGIALQPQHLQNMVLICFIRTRNRDYYVTCCLAVEST